MKLITANKFLKKSHNLLKYHKILESELESAFNKLKKNPFEPSLKTHKLHGKLSGYWACKVTNDLRIIFELVEDKKEICIFLHSIGKHDEVY